MKKAPQSGASWLCAKPDSSHENGNESQQENQNATADRQHDGHEGDDGLYDIVRLWGGLVSAHEKFLS
jgi:hypothetical protein